MISSQRVDVDLGARSHENALRLHENENPYGCSLLVQESLSIHDSFALCPGPLSRTLSGALARYTGRTSSDTYLANSPSELLSRLISLLVPAGEPLLTYVPYKSALRGVTAALGVENVPVRRAEDGRVRAVPALEYRGGARVVYLGSPNDPTGDVAAPLEVVTLLRAGFTVIADETYAEFTDKTLGILGREFPNLVSVRSFAPWAGLWGIPVSYALMRSELVIALEARWPQCGVTSASRIAAGASLDDAVLLFNRVKHIRLERARLFRRLRKLNFLQPRDSHGPFLLCEVTRGTADRVVALLWENEGVLVHDCAADGMPGFIRVSVGTPEHTDQLMGAMCRISVLL